MTIDRSTRAESYRSPVNGSNLGMAHCVAQPSEGSGRLTPTDGDRWRGWRVETAGMAATVSPSAYWVSAVLGLRVLTQLDLPFWTDRRWTGVRVAARLPRVGLVHGV